MNNESYSISLSNKDNCILLLDKTKEELKRTSIDFSYENNLTVDYSDKTCWTVDIKLNPPIRANEVEDILENLLLWSFNNLGLSVYGGLEIEEESEREVLTGNHQITFWKRG